MPETENQPDDALAERDLMEREEQHSSGELRFERRWEFVQSPLLPPHVLAQYGDVVDDLPSRLVQWTEQESQHRRDMERRAFEEVRVLRLRGQAIGAGVAVLGLLVAGYVAVAGMGTGAHLVASLIAIVGVGGPFAARLLAERWRGASVGVSDRHEDSQ